MKKWLLLICISLSGMSFCFPENTFSDILSGLSQDENDYNCPECGYENRRDAKFCTECGERLESRQGHSRKRDRDYDRRNHRDYRDRDRRDRDDEYRSDDRRRLPQRRSGPVSLGSFVKSDYKNDIKVYNLAGHTQNQSFSQVSVNVRVTQQWAVIIQVIKVQTHGQWSEIPVGARLQNGRNDFSVNIPQGSSQMVIAFNHGQGCEINVSME